jgi:hypothetical protein
MRLRWILAAVIALAVGGVVWWASSTQKAADDAKAETVAARQETAGAKLNTEAARETAAVVDRVALRGRSITQEVKRATETVRVALGEDAQVDGVVRAWADGVDSLRKQAAAADAGEAGGGDTPVRLLRVRADRTAGDAAARGARRAEAAAGIGRAFLRGRHGFHLDGAGRARALDRHAV